MSAFEEFELFGKRDADYGDERGEIEIGDGTGEAPRVFG